MEREVTYKAGLSWRGRLLSLLYAFFVCVLLVNRPDSLVRLWQGIGWIGKALISFFLMTIVLVPLESFVVSTNFTSTHIEHRSLWGLRTRKAYSEVSKLLRYTYFLQIQFDDGRKMKIWRSQGDMERMIAIVQAQTNKSIPVEAAF